MFSAEFQRMTSERPSLTGPAHQQRTTRIRKLNDAFRRTFIGGSIVISHGVDSLAPQIRADLLRLVRQFEDFETSSDPYGEHDFGAIELGGTRFFWKIDYYNGELDGGSEDPAAPTRTTRVLTIMLASEY